MHCSAYSSKSLCSTGERRIVQLQETYKPSQRDGGISIYHFDEPLLTGIIKENGAADLPIAIISVTGKFRQGKSYLLNYMIRYLNSKDKRNWMGARNAPLEGFSWRGGCEPHTSGIVVWSEIFCRLIDGFFGIAYLSLSI